MPIVETILEAKAEVISLPSTPAIFGAGDLRRWKAGYILHRQYCNLPIQVPLEEVLWEDPGWFLWEPVAIAMGGVELVRQGCHVGNIKDSWLPFLLGKSGTDRAGQSLKASRQESWGTLPLRLGRDKVLAPGSLLSLREAVGFPFLFC